MKFARVRTETKFGMSRRNDRYHNWNIEDTFLRVVAGKFFV